MASYSLKEFVGNGVLEEVLDSLIADGWDDVPTLKMMSAEDMDALNLTQQQRDALEIRSYLHDRSLMLYADKLEASGRNLADLLNESPTNLASIYGMKRGHVARFIDRTSTCAVKMPRTLRRSRESQHMEEYSRTNSNRSAGKEEPRALKDMNSNVNAGKELEEKKQTKGIVAAVPSEPRLCGLIPPARYDENITPVEVLEKISVQRVTPDNRKGVANPWEGQSVTLPPPFKASELWSHRPALLFIVRRPGCVMCRAEAHQLYARKPIFDAMGVQLVAVIGEYIESEVRAFWPRYWGGIVLLDNNREFFRALGGGDMLKENFITGFFFNPIACANYKRAKATGVQGNLVGEGLIKGGLYVIRPGKAGVAYQFVENNFGDWAPIDELVNVCSTLQQKTLENNYSYKTGV